MRENDVSPFALVNIGHSPALDSKGFLAANGGFALSVIAFLLWSRAHACQRAAAAWFP